MNPLRLRAANYRTFEEIDLALPNGCCAIVGENGAGKSSIINVIDLALFGPQSRTLADHLTDDAVDTDLMVELEFEHAQELYRVRRCYSARGRGKTTVDLEKHILHPESVGAGGEHGWLPLTRESAKATDQLIAETIGLSRETFRASAFLAQGDGAAFTEAQPRDRKRILAEVLGLAKWDGLLEQAKRDHSAAQTEIQRLDGGTAAARTVVETKEQVERDHSVYATVETEAAKDLAAAEATLTDVAGRYQHAREALAARTVADAELAAAAASLRTLIAAQQRATDAAETIRAAREELDQLTTGQQLDELAGREAMLAGLEEAFQAARAQHDAAAAAAKEATQRRFEMLRQVDEKLREEQRIQAKVAELKAAAPNAESCELCKQRLGAQALAATLDGLAAGGLVVHAEAVRLRDEANAIEVPDVPDEPEPPTVDGQPVAAALHNVRQQLAAAHAGLQQRARLEERIAACQREIAAEPDLADRLAHARALVDARAAALDELEPLDLAALEAEGHRARARVAEERDRLDKARVEKARAEERLEQIRSAEQQLADAAARTVELHAEVDLCVTLERAFGRDGIPALIVENAAIPQIEVEANRILADLGTSYRVELRTQAALKSGDGLRDTLDVIVVADGGERAYETFSGGERTRINLALRIALARLLAHRRGAESRLLAIDEPEFLDEAGTAALVDVLRGLAGDFDRVYLISHVPSLRDSFDQVLTVVKDGNRSRVEQGATLEAAAA